MTRKNTKTAKVKGDLKQSKDKKNEQKVKHPEFNIVIDDKEYDLETSLTICSNNGSDKKKTLYHARKKRMKKPILVEIDCEVASYNIKNFSLTVDETKDMIKELQKMVDYLEEV